MLRHLTSAILGHSQSFWRPTTVQKRCKAASQLRADDMERASDLLPELRQWNNGQGISVLDWLHTIAQSDHAIAYAALFWPEFVLVDSHVLRAPIVPTEFKRWDRQHANLPRQEREAMWNTFSFEDIFPTEEQSVLRDDRAVALGQILAEIHEAKLIRDFPDRRFIVEFWDGSQPEHGGEVSLSFWQDA